MNDLISRQAAIDAIDVKNVNKGIISALQSIIEELPSADRPREWITCSERLPTLNEDGTSDAVLLCWSDGQVTVGAYRGNRTFCGQAWPVAKDCRVTVVAWMPLPNSYREDGEEE